MKKRMGFIGLIIVWSFMMGGCVFWQEKMDEYSKDKECCTLNMENVTQFFYQSESYTILEDTVANGSLGDWIGYIRQLAAVDEDGKIIVQEDTHKASFQTLADLAGSAPDAAYIVPFLNVYVAPNDITYLIVDVNGGYHKAVPTDSVTEDMSIFNFRAAQQDATGNFEINPDNATQLLRNGITYQVTEETVSADMLGGYLDILAENVIFDANTKKPLPKEDINKIDWTGSDTTKREKWFYKEIYEISGTTTAEAVAVNVNNQYFLAKVQ